VIDIHRHRLAPVDLAGTTVLTDLAVELAHRLDDLGTSDLVLDAFGPPHGVGDAVLVEIEILRLVVVPWHRVFLHASLVLASGRYEAPGAVPRDLRPFGPPPSPTAEVTKTPGGGGRLVAPSVGAVASRDDRQEREMAAVAWFREVACDDVVVAGGKRANLGELARGRLPSAAGVRRKQITGTDLIDLIRRVATGQSLLDPGVMKRALELLRERPRRTSVSRASSPGASHP
jgi:hypothetical protein